MVHLHKSWLNLKYFTNKIALKYQNKTKDKKQAKRLFTN